MVPQNIINSAIPFEGYKHLVAYDPYHYGFQGQWVCKQCESMFMGGKIPFHNPGCSSEARITCQHPDLIYVFGPDENKYFTKLKEEDIEKIKKTIATVETVVKPMLLHLGMCIVVTLSGRSSC